MARLSGLQKEVLSLYRQCLRAIRDKPPETRPNFIEYTRQEFRGHAKVDRRDFGTIEYLIRKGWRQLEIYKDPGIKSIH